MTDTTTAGSDFLDVKLAEIRARMDELKPAVEEHARLTRAESALAGEFDQPARGGRRKQT